MQFTSIASKIAPNCFIQTFAGTGRIWFATYELLNDYKTRSLTKKFENIYRLFKWNTS